METETISLKDSNYFSSLMLNYVDLKDDLKPFYNRFPSIENYLPQAKDKIKSYSNRSVLVNQLTQQNLCLTATNKQQQNLNLLAQDNTVTITTGHQLNLFTGPIFFFYKILQVIKQCEVLNKYQNEINFVPVFWMATEDHDFKEINHFSFKERLFYWEKYFGGPVGRMSTDGLQEVFNSYFSFLPNGIKKDELNNLIKDSYLKSTNLAEATRKLVNMLFGEYGLLIIDGDDKELKKLMIPTFEKELLNQTSYKAVKTQSTLLEDLGYKIQVNPREINLFYIDNNLSRERIVYENEKYFILNTKISFTREEIIEELNNNPDRFSPNVILRPLYQETILPNVAYIGGGGELAYWLELKTMFKEFGIDFPLLVLRNSLLVRTEKDLDKQNKLELKNEDLFKNSLDITKEKILNISVLVNQMPSLKQELESIFSKFEEMASSANKTFLNMVEAQKAKQLKGFKKLEQRLMKAELRKEHLYEERVRDLLKNLNQENGLQERYKNFSDFDYVHLVQFINYIYTQIQPFSNSLIISTLPKSI